MNWHRWSRLLAKAGLDSPWVLDSYFTNQSGESLLDSGLGTRAFGNWSLSYRYRYRFSDGEQVNRIALGTSF
jgi:hypothetical protein